MATTFDTGTLVVRIVETFNGTDVGDEPRSLSIASVARVNWRVLTVLTSTGGNELLKLSTVEGAGQYITTTVKYVRITNLDDTNYVTLHVQSGSSDYVQFKLEAGKSFMLGNSKIDNATGIDSFSFADISSIQALANTASCQVEIVVATS